MSFKAHTRGNQCLTLYQLSQWKRRPLDPWSMNPSRVTLTDSSFWRWVHVKVTTMWTSVSHWQN